MNLNECKDFYRPGSIKSRNEILDWVFTFSLSEKIPFMRGTAGERKKTAYSIAVHPNNYLGTLLEAEYLCVWPIRMQWDRTLRILARTLR